MIEMPAAERHAVAAAIGVHEQYLYQCLTRKSGKELGAPPNLCPAIERATEGRVTCEELRPDIRWHRIPDPAWPHAEGRPAIDVAAPAQAETAA